MAKIFVLRGIPGSGKSTLTKEIVSKDGGAIVCSADDHFMKDGVYSFNPVELPQAHGACQRRFIAACQAAEPDVIIVDNTNLSVAEFAGYVNFGQAFGHDVEIITLMVDPAIAAARNIHGVPADRVNKMHEALVAGTAGIAPWWKHTVRES